MLLLIFPQNGRSPTLKAYNSGAKLQRKFERTKKKGEKLAVFSLYFLVKIIVKKLCRAFDHYIQISKVSSIARYNNIWFDGFR